MKKLIKDMTRAEKDAQIQHLSLKFYDIDAKPSSILNEETKYGVADEYMTTTIQKLEQMEFAHYQIEAEYNAKLANDLYPLKRIFEYEQKQLARRQASEHSVAFDFAKTEARHEQEMADLRRRQTERKKQITADALEKVKIHQQQMFIVFMDAVKHLYK